MSRSVRRRWAPLAVMMCAVLAGPIAVAHASDNDILATLNAYGPKIKKDESAIKKGLNEYQKSSRPLTRALKHEVSDLRALNKALRHESASSAKVRKAKKDFIEGFGLIASAYSSLRAEILAVHGGAISASEFDAVRATDTKGRHKVNAGLKLIQAT